jgi:VTC domain
MPEIDPVRRELKLLVGSTDQNYLHHLLSRIPTPITPLHPPRRINSIYFDTFTFDSFESNREGITNRTKVRYRWYGDGESSPSAALEIKMKRNKETWKVRYPTPGNHPLPAERTGMDSLARSVTRHLTPEGRLWLQSRPYATIKNAYYRQYYAARQGRIRITVDTDQLAWSSRGPSGWDWGQGVRISGAVIEIKFAPLDADYAAYIVGHLGLRLCKHSKYVASLESIAIG